MVPRRFGAEPHEPGALSVGDGRRVVEMKFESASGGSARYRASSETGAAAWLARLFGVALGVVVFLMIAAFFVAVVVPVVVLLALWSLVRRLLLPPPSR